MDDGRFSRDQADEKSQSFAQCSTLFCGALILAHRKGVTPYTYHEEEVKKDKKIRQHYFATAIWTSAIVLVVGEILLFQSPAWFDSLSQDGRNAFAVLGMVGMAAIVGLTAGIIHTGVSYYRGGKDRSAYSVQINAGRAIAPLKKDDDIEIPLGTINEDMGLVGSDQAGASVYRLGNCHPLRAIYPADPIKTMVWISVFTLAVLAVAAAANPDSFKQFAGNMPIVNGSVTNCTVNNVTVTDDTTCVSEVGYIMGVGATTFLSSITLGGAAGLFHGIAAGEVKCGRQVEKREASAPMAIALKFFNRVSVMCCY